MIISETKINKKLLLHDLMIMDYNQEDAEEELNINKNKNERHKNLQ